jgi:hypothetical protein
MDVTILYKIVNTETDPENGLYNAFQMPANGSVTLADVKQ